MAASLSHTLDVDAINARIELIPVAVIDGVTRTRADFRRAFDAVADKGDWKKTIMAELTPDTVRAVGGVEVIRQAVIFFTGSVPAIFPGPACAGDVIRVAAAGYYVAMGEI